jgi:LuxR family quorum sensing-dependent transcriptional regulator
MGGEHVDASKQALAFLHLVTVFAGTQMHKILSTDSKASGLLSRREREVLLWAANGKSAAETASVMNLAVSTIDKQIASAIRKLGSCTKTQAVAKALWAREIRL